MKYAQRDVLMPRRAERAAMRIILAVLGAFGLIAFKVNL